MYFATFNQAVVPAAIIAATAAASLSENFAINKKIKLTQVASTLFVPAQPFSCIFCCAIVIALTMISYISGRV